MKRQQNKVKQPRVDSFWDDADDKVSANDATIINPTRDDVIDEVAGLDSFRDFSRFNGNDALTYGDY